MNAAERVGLFGGTFDPIHVGHVETALTARRSLGLDRVIVLPARVPPHRPLQPVASPYHRFAMAALAVNGIEGLAASDIDLRAPGPSYTADTLTRFQEQWALTRAQIFFITGADAFAEIETWHRYPEVLDLANFVAVSRPGFPAEALRQRLPALAPRMEAAPGAGTAESPAIFLVNAPTPEVSSTDIRRRLRSGETLAGLVPAAVARHITQHGLYADNPASLTADHLHGQN
jgi:nicotinate-nucleotide adenylyltransferase